MKQQQLEDRIKELEAALLEIYQRNIYSISTAAEIAGEALGLNE